MRSRFLEPLAVALVALAMPAFVLAQAPKGATAKCQDDTYSTAATKRGACSGHGGVAAWLADTKTAAPKETKPAPANATGLCGDGTYTSAASSRGACSGHGGVSKWLA